MSKVIAILLVEADLAVRHPLAEYLRECGYKVLEVMNTDEAITALSAPDIVAEVRVVLCDVNGLGAVNGFGLSKWVRAHQPGIRVILAGNPAKAAEDAGCLCEEGPLLAKPYHHQTLLDRIKQEIARRDEARDKK